MIYKHKRGVLYLTRGAVIAALYVALTLLSASVGLAFGPIQLRLSEALCVLAVFLPEAVPGLTIGCLISNLFSPLGAGMVADLIFGSLATLIGAMGARWLRSRPLLSPLPTVAANTVVVPWVLAFFYGAEESVPYLMLTVGVGEVLSAWVLGLILLRALRPFASRFTGEDEHGV